MTATTRAAHVTVSFDGFGSSNLFTVTSLLSESQNITLALALGQHTMEGEGNTQREKRFKVRTSVTPSHTELSLWKTASVISSDIKACPSPVRTYTVRVRPRYRGGYLIISDLFSRGLIPLLE